jgi:nitronate monooxygenase
MNMSDNQFLKDSGVQYPIICGAMYPCSNPELLAAVAEAGGLPVIQPLSLTYVHGHEFREGIRAIRKMTNKPLALNLIVERSVKLYQKRMEEWLEVALEEGIRFIVTALGDPKWVVQQVEQAGGLVYHDVTERKYAEKALSRGVRGLICVNNRAGGHAGKKSPEELYRELHDLNVPLVQAGGIGCKADFEEAMALGYQGIQMGTRFIASQECTAHSEYKDAIVEAKADDIVLTTRVTGVPLAVINTPFLEKHGRDAGWLARRLLKGHKTKHWMRLYYSLRSVFRLKSSNFRALSTKDFWQAGKSVEGVTQVKTVKEIFEEFVS